MYSKPKKRTIVFTFANGKKSAKTVVYCPVHCFEVDLWQWDHEHRFCSEKGKDLISGTGLSLPNDDGITHFKTMARGA